MKPSAAAAASTAVGSSGVGEFGGAHWFAQQEADAAATPPLAAAAENSALTEEKPEAIIPAASGGAPPATSAPTDSAEGHVLISSRITVYSQGEVTLSWDIDTSHALPAQLPAGLLPSLPRVGLHALLPHSFECVRWYGLGPHECYPDRKTSGKLQQHCR